ncbi:MAG: DUF3341 domain-containing protein [Deltaproteobacteria bacterium]|nr:DUF3341 domain-containing protein [Deltaproteobacteria bacterium]
MSEKEKPFGIVAEFDSAKSLLHAAEKLSDQGYTVFDTHSPFPIHGMDDAMKLGQSKLPLIVFACAVVGFVSGLGLQAWVHNVEYPMIIAGKPDFALPAYIPVIFELTVLLGAFAAVFGMFGLNMLPRPNHPVFSHSRFHKASDDAFFVSIEAKDPKYDAAKTKDFLQQIGAKNVEVVHE